MSSIHPCTPPICARAQRPGGGKGGARGGVVCPLVSRYLKCSLMYSKSLPPAHHQLLAPSQRLSAHHRPSSLLPILHPSNPSHLHRPPSTFTRRTPPEPAPPGSALPLPQDLPARLELLVVPQETPGADNKGKRVKQYLRVAEEGGEGGI